MYESSYYFIVVQAVATIAKTEELVTIKTASSESACKLIVTYSFFSGIFGYIIFHSLKC